LVVVRRYFDNLSRMQFDAHLPLLHWPLQIRDSKIHREDGSNVGIEIVTKTLYSVAIALGRR
jgi:hypothetical protein